MTDVTSARASLKQAQALLDEVSNDVARLRDFVGWLEGARGRANQLNKVYLGEVQEALQVILQADPDEVTPPVANQDAVWETFGDFQDLILLVLRQVTAEVTAPLDAPAS